jgi:diguanylate cyclase (GGDEF)-like protein
MCPRVLQPRNEATAARASTILYLVGSVLLAVFLLGAHPLPLSPGVVRAGWVMFASLVLLGLVTVVVPTRHLTRLAIWPMLSIVAITGIGCIAWLFPDQVEMVPSLLAFPVLFSASQMRVPVAAGITTLAIAADVAILEISQPAAAVLLHSLYAVPALVLMTVLLGQAMNQQERLIKALRQQATVDSLTGLVTRRSFDEALRQALSMAGRPEGTALILVDIDGFKDINDTYGHPVGDDVLVHLATVLSEQVRAGDAVVSRLGGDELAVLLPDCTADTATRRAQQLVDAVRATPLELPDGGLVAISVSAGVAHAPRRVTELRSLYIAADAALYQAKQAGRDRAAVAATLS